MARDNAAGGRNRTPAQHGSRQEGSPGTGPGARAEVDWRDQKADARIGRVMIASAEICLLRDADTVLEVHRREIVDPRALTDPAMVADDQMPGVLH